MTHTPVKDGLRWQAIESCDVRAAGRFVYGREADGLYHSPICSLRPAQRTGILFFDTPKAAQAQGFEACSECYPDQAGWSDLVAGCDE